MFLKSPCLFVGVAIVSVTAACSDATSPDTADSPRTVQDTAPDAVAELRAGTRELDAPAARHSARQEAFADAAAHASESPEARARYYALRDELMRDPEVLDDLDVVLQSGPSYPVAEETR